MSYDARVFTVLVASPGDVQEERKAIAEIIHEWNYLNSRERSVVLLPLRWETHAHPELGAGPQAIINRQIVDDCDMAVGVFWTRLGTPTPEAESGSAEEIARVGESGKPVMMYFSNAPIPPGDLDLNELARLREYRKARYPQGLIEQYSSIQEFRDKFTRHISAKVMEIAAADAKRQSAEAETVGDVPEGAELLTLSVVKQPGEKVLENPIKIQKVICVDKESIPDYVGPGRSTVTTPGYITVTGLESSYLISESSNRDYYRQLVEYAEKTSTQLRFSFGLEAPQRAVRDVHVQMRMTTDGSLRLGSSPIYSPPSKVVAALGYSSNVNIFPPGGQVDVARVSRGEWEVRFNVPVVQIGLRISSPDIYMHVDGATNLRCEATVYSSESKPFLLEREMELNVIPKEMPYVEILKSLGEEL